MTLTSELIASLRAGKLVPYLGPDILSLAPEYAVPATPEALAEKLTEKIAVPHRIRKRLTQAAQFIENFKHRKTLTDRMNEIFLPVAQPSALHRWLAASGFPLIVDSWYDEAMATALQASATSWGQVQGLSQSEHFGTWTGWYAGDGKPVPERDASWQTLLYKPLGSSAPAANYLVSDSDFVEVLTEIDIQTPIPAEVQALRRGRSFLFLGCRFNDQLPRAFARQIMKRSSAQHWAVMPEEPTRMEKLFIAEQQIQRIPVSLAEFATLLMAHPVEAQPA